MRLDIIPRALSGCAAGAVAAMLCWSPAAAETGAPNGQAADTIQPEAKATPNAAADAADIIVTGTRLTTSGFKATVPVSVVSGEQLLTSAPASLSDGLNQMPEFRNSFVAASTGPLGSAGGGGAFLNLFGLSAKRTLVLLDGRRLPPTSVTGSVAGSSDINTLPQMLVKRVDVVSGGASAAYGSDAIAGVVNFVLDSEMTGLRGIVQGGISGQGDNASQRVGLAGGLNFGGGRGHIMAAIEYNRSDGVDGYGDRDWGRQGYAAIRTLSALPQTSLSNPARVIAANVRPSNASVGGLITSGPLAGYQFVQGGGIAAFPFGSLRTATTMAGGGTDPDFGTTFQSVPPLSRVSAFARATYEVANGWELFAEGLYGHSVSRYRGLLSSFATHQAYTIFSDNAYLPDSVRAQLGSTSSFSLGRIDYDWGYHQEYSMYEMARGVIGTKGHFGRFELNAYYAHAESTHNFASSGNANLTRLFDATDAVKVPAGTPGLTAGSIVCRTTLTNPTNGCVPLNVLGPNAATPAALAYILGTSWLDSKIKQDVGDVSLSGTPIDLWAGPVAISVGGSYRRESTVAVADAISESYNPAVPGSSVYKAGITPILSGNVNRFPAALRGQRGGWETTNAGGLAGSLNVKEVFGEIAIPLARDWLLAHSLDLNAAVRYADYSTSGGVTSWKGGATYEPVDGIRFRATRSRDVRAANLAELYQGVTQNNPAIVDPFRGSETNPNVVTRNFGNPNLKPEQGDTFTTGVILQPKFLPGFNLSVDYYHIKVTDTITQLGSQVIVNQCFQGATALCSLIQRDPTVTNGPIISVDNQFLNAGFTRTKGLDFETNYRLPLDRLFPQAKGVLTFRGTVNYVMELATRVTGATTTTDVAGRVGQLLPSGSGGGPKWSGNASVNYERGPFSLFVQERYIGPGVIDNTVDDQGNPLPATASVNANPTQSGLVPNHVGPVWYTDLTTTLKLPGDKFSVFFTINNLFDRDPPNIPTYFFYGTIPTNYQIYDVIGRTFTFGVKLKL